MELDLTLLLAHALLGCLLEKLLRVDLLVRHYAATRGKLFALLDQPDELAIGVINKLNQRVICGLTRRPVIEKHLQKVAN